MRRAMKASTVEANAGSSRGNEECGQDEGISTDETPVEGCRSREGDFVGSRRMGSSKSLVTPQCANLHLPLRADDLTDLHRTS
jgi:hypothetical protein